MKTCLECPTKLRCTMLGYCETNPAMPRTYQPKGLRLYDRALASRVLSWLPGHGADRGTPLPAPSPPPPPPPSEPLAMSDPALVPPKPPAAPAQAAPPAHNTSPQIIEIPGVGPNHVGRGWVVATGQTLHGVARTPKEFGDLMAAWAEHA